MKFGVSLKYAIAIVACVILCLKAVLGSDWQPATATWYGKLHGAGSEGNSNSDICNPKKYIKYVCKIFRK